MLPEPVSPELVLIDPELARRERARLEEKAYLQSVLDVAALRRASESQPPPVEETVRRRPPWRDATTFAKRRLVPAALLCSLLANGFLVADFVARQGEEAAQVAVRMVTLTESVPTAPPASAVATGQGEIRATTTVPTTTAPGTKADVERRIVSLILSAPASKLPRNFVNPTTGLVKNNVQVVCKKRKRRSFLCAVRLPSDSASRALYVRYRASKNGHGVFKWYGYRRS
ncbi:MAG: hypothetical protein M3P18_18500 [Actinomycetota bacterium]|nr:hypothetical protein [Actinomycetota bacterium]